MLSKNHPIILFIDRFGFSVYQDALTAIQKFNFTPDLVSNLDLVNKEQFTNLVATFIQINKIVGSSLAVVLSDDIIYIKDLANPAQKTVPAQDAKIDPNNDKENKDEVQSFLEDVPFEDVLAKVIKAGNINRIVAANKDLIMAIIDVFVSKGSIIEAIAPSFMYGQSANFTTGLTLDNVRVILGNTEALRLGNLLTDQEKMTPFQSLEEEKKQAPVNEKKKTQNLRQYILIGIFVTLLIILAVVYLNLGAPQAVPKSSKAKNTSTVAIDSPTPPAGGVSTISPALTQTLTTTVPIDTKNIKVKITQNSQTDEKAASFKSILLNIGIDDITNEVSDVSIPEKSSIVFSQSIPSDLRNNIVAEIKKILPEISILESQDANFTIKISIGKS